MRGMTGALGELIVMRSTARCVDVGDCEIRGKRLEGSSL